MEVLKTLNLNINICLYKYIEQEKLFGTIRHDLISVQTFYLMKNVLKTILYYFELLVLKIVVIFITMNLKWFNGIIKCRYGA